MQLREQDTQLCCPILESNMQIILLETLNKLGKAGEIVSVKDGFAKNFLIPQKKAIIANKKNRDDLTTRIAQINENNEIKIKEASDIKSKINEKEIKIYMEANEDGNLYGNIAPKQILEELKLEYNVNLSHENIVFKGIKSLGDHSVELKIYDNISANIKLEILRKS